MRKENFKGISFLLIIIVILISLTIIFVKALSIDTLQARLKNDQVLNVLFVMEDNNHVVVSDVFIYYPVSHRGVLVDIPGNTGGIYNVLGRVDRIDAIYTEKGIEAYKAEIEKLLGISIPFYITFSRKGFQEITDRMGGMNVFVPSPVDVVSKKGVHWLLPSGAVTLDGDKIDIYMNYKLDYETSEDVAERRQNVMLAFLSALSDKMAGKLTNQYFSGIIKNVKSNLKSKTVLTLFQILAKLNSETITTKIVTGNRRKVDSKVLLFPYYDGQLIKDVVKQSTSAIVSADGTKNNRVYVLEIQNGTSVQGLAHNTAALLKSAGYDVLSTLNADNNNYEHTWIIDHISNRDVSKSLANFIQCKNIVDEEQYLAKHDELASMSDDNVDFTIILGKDFDGRYVRGGYNWKKDEESDVSSIFKVKKAPSNDELLVTNDSH